MQRKLFFITREGLNSPGARNRCYYFSDYMVNQGLNCEVFSFIDKYSPGAGGTEVDMGFFQKSRFICLSFNELFRIATNSIFVINRFNYHSIPAWLVALFKNIPIVFDMDDWESREQIEGVYGIFSKSKAEYLTRKMVENSRFCVAASRYLESYLKQFNKNVYYLPTGVATNKFFKTTLIDKSDFIFSWHGSINRPEIVWYLKFICDCFMLLREKYPQIKLYFAGGGFYLKDFLGLLKDYHCASIVYNGCIDYKDIPLYLDNIDVGLIPLLDKSRFNLSKSPVKLFEYMAKAKPVIASDIGETNFIIENGTDGFLVSNKEEFVSRMEALITDKTLLAEIGCNALKKIKNGYSLDILAGKFYSHILDHFKDKC
jgi:glycosyltransferase involved in cell wall biosynthesis